MKADRWPPAPVMAIPPEISPNVPLKSSYSGRIGPALTMFTSFWPSHSFHTRPVRL